MRGVNDLQEQYTPEDVQRLQAMAQALSSAAATAADDEATSEGPQTPEALAAHLDALEASMDAFEGAFRDADPAVKGLLAGAISLPTSTTASGLSRSVSTATPAPPKSPLAYTARPPLAPPGSLDSTSTHHDVDVGRAWPASAPSSASAAVPPSSGLPPSGLRLSSLQRSAFASPRGTVSPSLAGSIGGTTPRGAPSSVGGLSSPHGVATLPPAPPPSLTHDQSPRRDALFPALTPANSLAGRVTEQGSIADCASSALASPVCAHVRHAPSGLPVPCTPLPAGPDWVR